MQQTTFVSRLERHSFLFFQFKPDLDGGDGTDCHTSGARRCREASSTSSSVLCLSPVGDMRRSVGAKAVGVQMRPGMDALLKYYTIVAGEDVKGAEISGS
jgi:hypothetical protein